MLFNEELPTKYPYVSSSFTLDEKSSLQEVMTTAIGQGDTLVSPFHMALIVSAIANEGKLMNPYFLDQIKSNEGVSVYQSEPTVYKELMTKEEADILKEMMVSVVEGGTGSSAAVPIAKDIFDNYYYYY